MTSGNIPEMLRKEIRSNGELGMVHKNSVILVKARKASNTSGGYYFCILLVLISELIIYYKNR